MTHVMKHSDEIEIPPLQCTNCGSLQPAIPSADGDGVVPAAERVCAVCRNDEFVAVVLHAEEHRS